MKRQFKAKLAARVIPNANSMSLDKHDMVAKASSLKDIPREVVILFHC